MIEKLPPKVIEKLRWYVYLYVDPRNDVVFYVGKGKGNRMFNHMAESGDSAKVTRLKELKQLGIDPRIELLKYGLPQEEQALLVESAAIDLLGVDQLTNRVRGHWSRFGNRDPVEQVVAELNAREVKIKHPSILINISNSFTPNLTPHELYDMTRSAWRISAHRVEKTDFAMAVFRRVIREVYEIAAWVPNGSTLRVMDNGYRKQGATDSGKRLEFVGNVAAETVRSHYRGRSVAAYFPTGSQNPIRYAGMNE